MHSPHDPSNTARFDALAASFDALEARLDAFEAHIIARLDRLTRAVLAFGVAFLLSQVGVIVTLILRT